MDAWDDLHGMGPSDHDMTVLEGLISGDVGSDDVAPRFSRVAALIDAARGPATVEELATRDATVTAFAASARVHAGARARRKTVSTLSRFPTKVLALAAPIALMGVGVAAATSSLPSAAQSAVSRALSDVGISVPDPQNGAHTIGGSAESGTTGASSPGTGSSSATPGTSTVEQCTAWNAGDLSRSALRNLAAAAGGAKSIATYCLGLVASSAHPTTAGGAQNAPAAGRHVGGQGVIPSAGGPRIVTSSAGPVCSTLSGSATSVTDPPTVSGCTQPDLTGGSGTFPAHGWSLSGSSIVTWRTGGTTTIQYSSVVPQGRADQCGPDPTSPGNQETEAILHGSVQPGSGVRGAVRAKICVTSTFDLSLVPGQSFTF